jgi:hypothetical protein
VLAIVPACMLRHAIPIPRLAVSYCAMIGYVMPWLLTHSLLLCGMHVRTSMPHDVASEGVNSF